MADLHRGLLRYDLRLTGAQVTGVVIGSMVTVGVAFALGVGFGRRLAAGDAPKPPPPISSTAPDAGHPLELTYDRDLTKNNPTPKPPPPALKPPAPAPIPIAAAAPVDAGAPDAGTPTQSMDAGTPHSLDLPPPLPTLANEPVTPPAGVIEDRFAVQFGAPANRGDADKLAATLSKLGYGAYVVPAEVPNHGTVYRVRVGRFATKEAADALRQDATSHHQLTGIVMHVQ